MGIRGVEFVRNEVSSMLKIWWMIRDAIEGETAIKGQYGLKAEFFMTSDRFRRKAEDYLPRPIPTDTSIENELRYRDYVKRAVYYNFTARTLNGLVGQIFLRNPVANIPSSIDVINNNCDGEGMSIDQVAKRVCRSVLSFGRAGLFTDYPNTDGTVAKSDMASRGIRPAIKHYHPWQVINWGTSTRGMNEVLSLVVLKEIHRRTVDEFAVEDVIKYRVLRLDTTSWVYSVQVWEEGDSNKYSQTSSYIPKDAAGNTFDEIPFTFVGSEANDNMPDIPPMYDLASLNIAHYRNSADYEESCFQTGQPTPVISGVTEHWVTNVLKGSIQLGSRASITLPENASAQLLQASANSMPLEAMRHKEEEAASLGAKLVQQTKKERTATEALIDTTTESSTLHNVANNTSQAMEKNLTWAQRYADMEASEKIQYQLNTEFEFTRMSANDRLALVKMWQSGAIAFEEMRSALRVDGTATLDDDVAKEKITKEQAEAAVLGGAAIADPLQATSPKAPQNAIVKG